LTVLLFQRGAFDAGTTDRVTLALQFFALGLIFHSALEVVSRLFYAQQDMWTPLWAALAGVVTNGTLGWLLLPSLAQGGIALSNSLAVGLQVGLLLLAARRRLNGIEGQALVVSLGRTVVASGVMAAAVVGFQALVPGLGSRLVGVGGLVVGSATYVVTATLLGSEELRQLPKLLLRRSARLDQLSS
jgi:putative peptidoglycan lipid II flippase